jgi:SAM-dependent methyltransferase
MAQEDQLKWDKKYTENEKLLGFREPSPLLEQFYVHAPGNRALDIACGTGRNTLYLAANGFEVDALDISAVALQELTQHMQKATDLTFIHTQLVDLDYYSPEQTYDLIIQTNFLDRALIPKLAKALNKGGLLIIETYMIDPENEKKGSNTAYLLQSNELPSYFDTHYEVLFYDEFWNRGENYRMCKQGIVVKSRHKS